MLEESPLGLRLIYPYLGQATAFVSKVSGYSIAMIAGRRSRSLKVPAVRLLEGMSSVGHRRLRVRNSERRRSVGRALV